MKRIFLKIESDDWIDGLQIEWDVEAFERSDNQAFSSGVRDVINGLGLLTSSNRKLRSALESIWRMKSYNL